LGNCFGEPIIYTRRQETNKTKQPSSGGFIIGSSHASKKGLGATSPPTRRRGKGLRMNCMIALILSFNNYLTLTRVSLKGERRRDMPPLDNIEDNYVGIEETNN